MKKNKAFRAAAFVSALLYLTACGNEIEYPEGADTLPTYSATGTVITVYDTSSVTTPEITTTASAATTTSVTTTVPETETETETETQTVPSESETTADTSLSLSLEDVPEVGISEYYEKTQTSPTRPTVTQTSAVSDTSAVSETSPVTQSAVNTESSSDITSSSDGVLTSASSETEYENPVQTADINSSTSSVNIHAKLTDGRTSRFTGKEIISHPYSYYTLTEKHKKLYDKLVSAMLNIEEDVIFEDSEEISFDELFDIYQLLYNDENRLFYISSTIEYTTDMESGYISSMNLKYNYTKTEIQKMQEELDAKTAEIFSSVTPDMSEYEIVKHFHDYIIQNCTYTEDCKNPNNIYGTLVEQVALCQGYSQSFTYLCSLAGIDSFIVLGVANEPHMWNIVKMDNDYYHIDLTWDDPDRAKNPDSVRYDYFGLTDERIRQLRQFDDYDYEIPEAKGTKYQYYYHNNLVADSTAEAKAILISEVKKASQAKASTVQLLCTDNEAYEEITSLFFGNSSGNVIGILGEIKDDVADKFNTESIYHNSNRDTRVIKIYLEYLD